MTSSLTVSVIVPAHNAEAFLAEAVRSILEQGHQSLEIIIVDDGSTDGTCAVAANLQVESGGSVRCVSQPQAGPAAARNRGLTLAQGGLVGFLDADDLWPPHSLECRLAPLRADPSLAVVLGQTRVLWMPESGAGPVAMSTDTFPSPNLGCALFRKSVFDEVGGFDPALRFSEDVDWFLRARECGVALVKIAQTTLLYRRHTSNMTRGKTVTDLRLTEVLKQSLDRRRQPGGVRPLPAISSAEGGTP